MTYVHVLNNINPKYIQRLVFFEKEKPTLAAASSIRLAKEAKSYAGASHECRTSAAATSRIGARIDSNGYALVCINIFVASIRDRGWLLTLQSEWLLAFRLQETQKTT